MRKMLTIVCVLSLLFSCKDGANKNVEVNQMEKVMAIHDEVMPKMGKLGKLVAELKPKVDSTEMGLQYGDAMKDLQDSHESMMSWMQNFGKRFDHDEIMNGKKLTAQKAEWLNEEEESVKALREQINLSIKKAELLLEKAN